jgi:hypothetical protein
MLSNFDLNELFLFPVKNEEARKNFLIAALVYLAAFIVPILPIIVVMGYTARILRQVVNGGSPRMPAWDDWDSMLKDGLYIFGVRLIYMLPLFIILVPPFFGVIFLPVWLDSNNANEQLAVVLPMLFGLVMLVAFPLSLALGLILPAAEIHTIVHNDFAAGFRFREWWPIFRVNWIGFLLAALIAYLFSAFLSFIVGVAMMTIILFCVLPFIMPAVNAYITFIMYAAFASAYKEGKDRLAQAVQPPVASSPTDATLAQ